MREPDIDAAEVAASLEGVFGRSTPLSFERTAEGVSTQVYRVFRGCEVFYLRIAEEADHNLETDAELHGRLRDLGISVPEILHVDPFNARLGRSTLITTELPGIAMAQLPSLTGCHAMLEQAGEQLARMHRVPVDGFGFVRRSGRHWPLSAPHSTYASSVVSHLPNPWPGPLGTLFDTDALSALEAIIDQERDRSEVRAVLSHGDFDADAIFCADGRYTGIIDFGEVRGAEATFDLGHFLLQHDTALLTQLLCGYQSREHDHEASIVRSAVLLGLRQLCRWLGPPRRRAVTHPSVTSRACRISALLLLDACASR